MNVAKPREVNDHYETSFYGTGRIIASMADTHTLYVSTGTGQSGCTTSKYYYDGGLKHAKGVFNKMA